MKVSQLTPSTQVLSSVEPPPTAVPAQFTAGPLGLSVPELGAAERTPVVESASTSRTMALIRKSAPRVARAVIEVEPFFIENLSTSGWRRTSAFFA
jgi:hypothetical protein